jgi:hypothetical protein
VGNIWMDGWRELRLWQLSSHEYNNCISQFSHNIVHCTSNDIFWSPGYPASHNTIGTLKFVHDCTLYMHCRSLYESPDSTKYTMSYFLTVLFNSPVFHNALWSLQRYPPHQRRQTPHH